MFIDIHTHVRRIPGFPRHGKPAYATPQQLIQRFEEHNIEKSVLLPGVSPEAAYAPQTNEEILEISNDYPDRFIPFCNIDPRFLSNSPEAPLHEILAYYKDKGCKGVGEITANIPFLDPKVRNLFRSAESVGLPLTFHIAPQIGGLYGLYDDPGLPGLECSLRSFSKLRFLGHSQAFWAEIGVLRTPGDRYGYPRGPIETEGVVPELLRRYENLYGDLSAGSGFNALNRDHDYAVKFLNEFQNRLLFGTDICAPDTPAPLPALLEKFRDEGKISEIVFNKIARENAIKLLGLE